ncbi:hypothetical protein [Microbacterium sp. SS28]|uniref:hypothetical protein n=1 Tax=Microbacterium sp. SS28 TaxID=2919948 RepID=UPI001FAA93B5|nr:hypothetical protein [Microbacterium sp. SS28]
MPRRSDLPPSLSGRSFSVHEALATGVTAGRLDAKDLVIPYRGLRQLQGEGPRDTLERCRQYAPRLKPWQFYSHETALALHGVPTPRFPHRVAIHVSAHRPAREPRIDGIVGHRLQTRDDASVVIESFRVESAARAWRQAATSWRIDDLIAAADFIVGRGGLTTVEELRNEARTMRGPRHRALERALLDVRAGSASSEETRLRLVLARAGLPEPDLNWVVHDERGVLVAVLDLAFVRWKVDVEYDGRQHAEDADQYFRDVERRASLRALGWSQVQIVKQHLRGDGRLAVALVRQALVQAGWRG